MKTKQYKKPILSNSTAGHVRVILLALYGFV
jgi:hypothetical protein